MKRLEIKEKFYLDGRPFQIISGALHYFRVVPEYWTDRLEKLKAMGCNTVETYIPWNVHEPEKGNFCFTGMRDIKKFVLEAWRLGLYVILRPSPYICAEWEFGGLPAWLLKEDSMRIRTCSESFLRHVREYYAVLMKEIAPLQLDYGGPVILMQLENEYGYFGNDSRYLKELKNMYRDYGIVAPLVTSDGPEEYNLKCGGIDGVLATANFGSGTKERYREVKKVIGDSPFMCMEFWAGWFDYWGNEGHMTSDPAENAADFEELLKLGNVNIYMFHGGTNFGFMNGSNYYGELNPDVTSYDYDAALTEDGEITEKYRQLQRVISKYYPLPQVTFSTDIKKISYGRLEVKDKTGLFEALEELSSPIVSATPLSMEKCGQNYGYLLYESELVMDPVIRSVQLIGANDRANLYLDNRPAGILYDKELLGELRLDGHQESSKISILMENMGRVNYGEKMNHQRKGIDQAVLVNGRGQCNWRQFPLPLDNLKALSFTKGYTEGEPVFYKFTFEADAAGDTFLDFTGWGKGCAFVNGFPVGRYWNRGPQKRLYIPGPLLKTGENEIILFETDGTVSDGITLKSSPDLGERKTPYQEPVSVNPDRTAPFNRKKFQGWGTSFGWWANRIGYSERLTEKAAGIFYGKEGLALNIVRYNIGGGDDPAHMHISRTDSDIPGYAQNIRFDPESGKYTWTYNWNADKNQFSVMRQAAKACEDEVILEAFSNSPPYFMTESGCSSGAVHGTDDNLKPEYYEAFAVYLADIIHHWAQNGVKFESVSPMNEPSTDYWTANSRKQEGCHFNQGKSQSAILKLLKRELIKRNLSETVISGTDETDIDTQIEAYNRLDGEAKKVISRIDVHSYMGKKMTQLKELAVKEQKNLWMTEADGGETGGTDAGEMGAGLWLALRIIRDLNELQPTAWVMWQVIDSHICSGEYRGRRDSGMADLDRGYWGTAIADHDKEDILLTMKYYAFGQFTRYIRPGCSIIPGDEFSVAAYNKDEKKLVIAAVNPKDKTVTKNFDLTLLRDHFSNVQMVRTSGTLSRGEKWSAVKEDYKLEEKQLTVTLKENSITTFILSES